MSHPFFSIENTFCLRYLEVTTVEGVLQRTETGLLQDQERRRELDPENAQKIEEFIMKIDEHVSLRRPFTFVCFYLCFFKLVFDLWLQFPSFGWGL